MAIPSICLAVGFRKTEIRREKAIIRTLWLQCYFPASSAAAVLRIDKDS